MKIATKTQRHKVTQKVSLKINPSCLCAFVASEEKMNIKKFNQQFRWFLVLVIVVLWGANSLYAAGSKGPVLKVTTKDGMKLKGKLLSVSDRTLVMLDQESLKEMKVAIDDLKNITVYKPRKNKFLKGLLFGIGSGLAVTAANDNAVEDEYRGLWLATSALMGVVLGSVSTLFAKLARKTHRYDITKMSASEIEALLSLLGRSYRENIVWGDSYKDGLLGRFRISWRPYIKPRMSQDITGDLRLADNSWPGTVHSSAIGRISGNDGNHVSRIRVDYALNNKLSLGFEYIPQEEFKIWVDGDIHMILDQQDYHYYNYFAGSHTSNIGLIGVNLEYPVKDYLGFRIETGIGLSFSQMTLRRYDPFQWPIPVADSYSTVKPAFQLGVSVDICPRDPFSYGIFASYLYSHVSFRGIQSKISAGFISNNNTGTQPAAFTRDVVVSIPRVDFNLGGFTFGFVLRLR